MTTADHKDLTIDLGVLIAEPADVYHAKAKDFLSAHALNEFRRCPLLYRKKELGLVPERDTTAYLMGRAAHTLILEGRQRYEREFAVGGPINPRTGQPFGSQTKAFAEWAERQGRPVLSDTQAATIEQMAAAVQEHIYARELLAEGVAEGVVRCEYGGHRCQARIDWINPVESRGIVDLKTADEIDSFELSMRAFGYLHQVAFYRALVSQASGHVLPVHIVAVEKREPYRCGVWQVTPEVLDQAQRENEEAMTDLRRCRETGDWFTRYESMRLVDRL
ncbi:MAG TPA: PD-(D/E)XK nuclease-like domain-containing protein [Phycisphaerae bacterium]|mgnify:CR=1 FL=1|nr:PD-(D/E)XK nuclease-like domain-containing protein [Phycisphaerae bacterium]HOM53596.1 PD-(D/E)XK nuclease-like domain-containing protein [Phycisphaerae bacterium]HPP28954.1 PD-(D/E)XK nuclease-like domain-containing protein [Phycisphaerae bacterium]HQA00539.1 PD-(D/E)XK nuclease-like domain-containing protein [Phycisphaerae bacterium]HQE28010.1 PD-(D/E)XK nuclease-like domain-containing protein [Phycisphaerae bacterium]